MMLVGLQQKEFRQVSHSASIYIQKSVKPVVCVFVPHNWFTLAAFETTNKTNDEDNFFMKGLSHTCAHTDGRTHAHTPSA